MRKTIFSCNMHAALTLRRRCHSAALGGWVMTALLTPFAAVPPQSRSAQRPPTKGGFPTALISLALIPELKGTVRPASLTGAEAMPVNARFLSCPHPGDAARHQRQRVLIHSRPSSVVGCPRRCFLIFAPDPVLSSPDAARGQDIRD